jgi:hypothetical protein
MGHMKVHEFVKYIPEGRENGISRAELARLSGINDRHMRKLVEMARCDGVPIINLQNGEGYYISHDPLEMRAQFNINQARIRVLAAQQTHLARLLNKAGTKV